MARTLMESAPPELSVEPEVAAPPEVAPPSPERVAAVAVAREGWIRRLIDVSRRNNLLFFRDLKAGTVDLSAATGTAMLPFLRGENAPLGSFVAREEEAGIASRIREIRGKALANLEERGLETLYLAMGMATWEPRDGGRPAEAAVLLIPTEVEARGREGRSFTLRRTGEIQVNLVLLHVLETEYGVSIAPEQLIAALQGDDEEEGFDPEPVYTLLGEAARTVPGFGVRPRLVLGNFAYQKIAMVRDLREFGDQMARHDLIAALAGDSAARADVQSRRVPADPALLDETPPEDEFLVLDADSSQQAVVRQALADQDGVVQGPPGTGKSQTIANLIAELSAKGKKVLFVAEKRAALEAVLQRLEKAGLTHLTLDLHGAEVSRRELMRQFSETLQVVTTTPPVDGGNLHEKFVQRRKRLNEYARLIHASQAPSNRSAFQLQGRLLELARSVSSETRWRNDELSRLGPAELNSIRDALDELAGFESLYLRTDPSPWTGSRLLDGATVRRAMDEAQLLAKRWAEFKLALEAVERESGLQKPMTLPEVQLQLELMSDVSKTLETYAEPLFEPGTLEALLVPLVPAGAGALKRLWAYASNADYRAALRNAQLLRKRGKAGARQILLELRAAHEQAARWRTRSADGRPPHVAPSLGVAVKTRDEFLASIRTLRALVEIPDKQPTTLLDWDDWSRRLAADQATPHRIPRLTELEAVLEHHGLADFTAELRRSKPVGENFADTFEHAWLSSCMESVRSQHPELAGFNGRTHDKLAAEFRRLDAERIQLAAERVRRSHAERAVRVMNEFPDQQALVKREAARKARHMPFRKLVREAGPVLTALRPCWMASPLSVSNLLPADRSLFDVILFDEASQVLPEDAVPALLRGRNAILAGDRHQLPPTSFFLASDEEDIEVEDPAPTQGFESILDLMSGLLQPWPLDWHYRSRDESLIAFSNRHIYDGRLVTFPSPARDRAIRHVRVEPAPPRDGETDSSPDEVAAVVGLVLEHARSRPEESLGVIALGIQHSRRLEAAIEEALKAHPELDGFFNQARAERFFVKNLERVQGDERDAVILSVGYAKDLSGRLPYRFGPLLMAGGERRLNVAITRARNRMTVVSSFTHHDMDPNRSRARGVELLRSYLEYAASGGTHLGTDGVTQFASNAFERDVCDALAAKGVHVLEQWGASRYRIDLVARHPEDPGRFVLAIECDGAAYHASASARDRDRLRQQHLEKLGWRFHRIWSTDWFTRRDEEVERTLAAIQVAVRASDEGGVAAPRVEPATAPRPARPTVGHGIRDVRPRLGSRDSIDDYAAEELVALVDWIQSDGQLRTDDDLFEEAFAELDFDRRGPRITSAIRHAIRAWRAEQQGTA